MTKEELKTDLKKNHKKFIDHVDLLSKEEFEFSKNQKWTAGQELDHIVKSILPIAKIINNKDFIRSKFGTTNRDNLSYNELVDRYRNELKKRDEIPSQFIPEEIRWSQKKELQNQIMDIVNDIAAYLDLYSEEELNELILPHPLLGALTIQEMMLFTIYHVEHHLENSLKNLMSASLSHK
jgi:hypothetical protein